MNAKEAKFAAQKKAIELKEKREAAERRRQEQASKEWREERANWFKNELEWIASLIAEAVDRGKTKTSIHLATSDEREQAEEKAFWDRFAFKPELAKVIAHFEGLDYKVKIVVKKKENIDLSDLSPRDNWFTYETVLEVSW